MVNSRSAHAAMLLFAFLISTSFTIGQYIANYLDPVVLIFLRFLMAVPILYGLVKWQGLRLEFPRGKNLLKHFWLSFIVVFYFVSMFAALRITDALSISAVFTLTPLMTLIIAAVILRERLSTMSLIAMVIAGIGALWVMFDGNAVKLTRFEVGRGELIMLVGCGIYATHSPSIRLFFREANLLALTFWIVVFGVLLLAIWGGREIIATDWLGVPGFVYLGVLHLAVFTTAATFYLIQYASQRLPASKVMAYTYLIPAFVVVQNAIIGGGLPGWNLLAGVLVIAAAMIVLQRGKTSIR